MSALIKETKSFRLESEEAVTEFLEKLKEKAFEEGYDIAAYKSTKKVKKAKGEIIAEAWLLEVTFVYEDFWSEV